MQGLDYDYLECIVDNWTNGNKTDARVMFKTMEPLLQVQALVLVHAGIFPGCEVVFDVASHYVARELE